MWIHIPNGFLTVDRFLTGGRFSTSMLRFGNYMMHDRHPTVVVSTHLIPMARHRCRLILLDLLHTHSLRLGVSVSPRGMVATAYASQNIRVHQHILALFLSISLSHDRPRLHYARQSCVPYVPLPLRLFNLLSWPELQHLRFR